jgi:hypothetical protein
VNFPQFLEALLRHVRGEVIVFLILLGDDEEIIVGDPRLKDLMNT